MKKRNSVSLCIFSGLMALFLFPLLLVSSCGDDNSESRVGEPCQTKDDCGKDEDCIEGKCTAENEGEESDDSRGESFVSADCTDESSVTLESDETSGPLTSTLLLSFKFLDGSLKAGITAMRISLFDASTVSGSDTCSLVSGEVRENRLAQAIQPMADGDFVELEDLPTRTSLIILGEGLNEKGGIQARGCADSVILESASETVELLMFGLQFALEGKYGSEPISVPMEIDPTVEAALNLFWKKVEDTMPESYTFWHDEVYVKMVEFFKSAYVRVAFELSTDKMAVTGTLTVLEISDGKDLVADVSDLGLTGQLEEGYLLTYDSFVVPKCTISIDLVAIFEVIIKAMNVPEKYQDDIEIILGLLQLVGAIQVNSVSMSFSDGKIFNMDLDEKGEEMRGMTNVTIYTSKQPVPLPPAPFIAYEQ